MKPNVFWFNDCRSSWCHAIVEWLTAECNHPNTLFTDTEHWEQPSPAVVVAKADQLSALRTHQLNEFLGDFRSVLLFITANEEGEFDPVSIRHKRMRMWIQTPTAAQRQWASCGIPWGWTPGFDGTKWQSRLPGYESAEADRMIAYSFVGQNTHERRHQCISALEEQCSHWPNCVLTSHGFSRGLPRHLYFELLMNSKIAICPSGPRTMDTFRVWEALECGAVPIIDGRSARDTEDYWPFILGPEHPLTVIKEWSWETEATIDQILNHWAVMQPVTLKWWAERKAFWQRKFQTDLEMLNG